MKGNTVLRILTTALLLFVAFAGYRAYFWGDLHKHWPQVTINAVADVLVATGCGLLLYTLQIRKTFRAWFLPSVLVLIGIFSFALYWVHATVLTFFGLLTADFKDFFNAVCFQLLDSVAIVVSGSLAVIIQQQHYDRKQIVRAMEVMELENKRAELKYLKSQMDPHFVFNGLNMIYHQVPEESKVARESLLQFSGILRYHLNYAAGDRVSLLEEMEYLSSYVQFQKKRCSDFMEIEEDMKVEEGDAGIEPLLLLPLVENAVKFCNGDGASKGKMKVFMRQRNKKLTFQVENSYQPDQTHRYKGTGIGLENVKRRLSIMYPGRHDFQIINAPDAKMFTCNLEIWS
jgi:two-component system LytT family sensor kinase